MTDISMIVHAGRMVAAHDLPSIADGGVAVAGDTIREIGHVRELATKYPAAVRVGGDRFLLIPGLINGHGHGRGLSTFQRGVMDSGLETWIWDTRRCPPLPIYEDVAHSACRLLKAGVTTTMHNHLAVNPADCDREYARALQAYQDIGMRVFFCPGVRNVNPFVYGDNQAFLMSLPKPLRDYWAAVVSQPLPDADSYVESVKKLYAAYQGAKIRIGFGPLAPQWCSLDLLQETLKAACHLNTMVHIHVGESILQKIYGLSEWDRSLIRFMAGHDLLGDNVVIGHGVWMTRADIELMATTGTGVTHQPSSNLRLKSGVAPIGPMVKAGLRVGLGLDGMAINDDDDMIQEMRLCLLLHRLNALDIVAPSLTAREIFKMATEANAQLVGYGQELGRLEPGRKADMVLLDYESMCQPYTEPSIDPVETLLYRGAGRHVHTVIVDGKIVVADGRMMSFDEEAISTRLAAAAAQPVSTAQKEKALMTEALKKHLMHYYRDWTERIAVRPFYIANSRTDQYL